MGIFFTIPMENYSSVSKRKIPAVFWQHYIVFSFIQHFIAKILFSTMLGG